MPVEQKVKAVLQSAETILELAIIEPSRYGPIIHSNIPDYAEIFLKIYLEEGMNIAPPDPDRRSFKQLIDEVKNNPGQIAIVDLDPITAYFLSIRDDFRNPLHHREYVQGFMITRPVALECLLQFDRLLNLLFPNMQALSDLNYYSYIKFIKMVFDEDRGVGDHEKYQRVILALIKIEKREKYKSPPGYDTGRVFSVRQLFKHSDETFSIVALGYRIGLTEKIINILLEVDSTMKTKVIIEKLKEDQLYTGIQRKEVEACLQHIQNKRLPSGAMIVILGGSYYLSQ